MILLRPLLSHYVLGTNNQTFRVYFLPFVNSCYASWGFLVKNKKKTSQKILNPIKTDNFSNLILPKK
jgi:hypothetical protein